MWVHSQESGFNSLSSRPVWKKNGCVPNKRWQYLADPKVFVFGAPKLTPKFALQISGCSVLLSLNSSLLWCWHCCNPCLLCPMQMVCSSSTVWFFKRTESRRNWRLDAMKSNNLNSAAQFGVSYSEVQILCMLNIIWQKKS